MNRLITLSLIAGITLGNLLTASEPPVIEVSCANLVYAGDKTSKCFSRGFLGEIEKRTHIEAKNTFDVVHMKSSELFQHPFAVMSGEGSFKLTADERLNLNQYLLNGGFLVASAGCSSKSWQKSFESEIQAVFPDRELQKLGPEHPIFHTVSDVGMSKYKSGRTKFPDLYGLEIDGRIVMVYSPDGLNDTAGVGTSNCCCCGGNEIKAAKLINMNLFAFALTH